MPDNDDSQGLVSLADLKRVAELFDAAENALEPDSPEARESQVAYDNAVQSLYDEKVGTHPDFKSVPEPLFKAKLRTLCRQFLRKN